jgi:hypothetical protein
MIASTTALLALSVLGHALPQGSPSDPSAAAGYLFAAFKGDVPHVFFLTAPADKPSTFQALNGGQATLIPTTGTGGARDPYIFRAQDKSKVRCRMILLLQRHGRTDALLSLVYRTGHRSRDQQDQLGRSASNRLQKHLHLGILHRRRNLVSRASGRADAANSRLRESPNPPTKIPATPILTNNPQGLGPLRNVGRPNLLLRHLLVLGNLLRLRHFTHRALARPLHFLLAHQRLQHFHFAPALESRYHGYSHRPRNPVPRWRILHPISQRHQRGEARRPGAIGQWTFRRLEACWGSC